MRVVDQQAQRGQAAAIDVGDGAAGIRVHIEGFVAAVAEPGLLQARHRVIQRLLAAERDGFAPGTSRALHRGGGGMGYPSDGVLAEQQP